MPEMLSRRELCEKWGVAGTLAAGWSATAAGYPANETLRVAGIGIGGRGRHLLNTLRKVPGVKIVAVADVWDQSLAEAKKIAELDAFLTRDYRRVLDRPDVDAVLIAAPDHWHAPLCHAAFAAGKDVYCEKPLTHTRAEGAALLAAHAHAKRIVQVGTQQRSMPHLQEARAMVQAGKLGTVVKADLSWNRNAGRGAATHNIDPASLDWKAFLGTAPEQDFNAYRFREWRWFWDFGGGLFTDLMVHWIDVVHWCVGVEAPTKAVSIGNHVHAGGKWQTPDTVQTLLQYPRGDAPALQAHYDGTFSNAHRAAMCTLMGTEATLYLDRGRYEFTPEHFKPGSATVIPGKEKLRRGSDFYAEPDGELLHLSNWVACVRSRQQPNAPLAGGVASADAAHLANEALRGSGAALRPG